MKQLDDERLIAGLELLRRTGAKSVALRHDEPEDEGPVVWMTVVEWNVVSLGNNVGKPAPDAEDTGKRGYEVAAAFDPLTATMRLCKEVLEGTTKCVHCQRQTMFDEDFGEVPLDNVFCWYQWDPENKTFRRGCEGDEGVFQKVGRNQPCPCGSGKKFKNCHG